MKYNHDHKPAIIQFNAASEYITKNRREKDARAKKMFQFWLVILSLVFYLFYLVLSGKL